jgi:outer membrane receptor protein involved in Fe transport
VSDNFSTCAGGTPSSSGWTQAYRQEVRQGGLKLTAPLGNPLGTFNFSGQWTGNQGWPGQPHSQGNAFADFLLGTADSSNYGIAPTDIQIGSSDWEFYAQDTWQATPKLTLNFGLRYNTSSMASSRQSRELPGPHNTSWRCLRIPPR